MMHGYKCKILESSEQAAFFFFYSPEPCSSSLNPLRPSNARQRIFLEQPITDRQSSPCAAARCAIVTTVCRDSAVFRYLAVVDFEAFQPQNSFCSCSYSRTSFEELVIPCDVPSSILLQSLNRCLITPSRGV